MWMDDLSDKPILTFIHPKQQEEIYLIHNVKLRQQTIVADSPHLQR